MTMRIGDECTPACGYPGGGETQAPREFEVHLPVSVIVTVHPDGRREFGIPGPCDGSVLYSAAEEGAWEEAADEWVRMDREDGGLSEAWWEALGLLAGWAQAAHDLCAVTPPTRDELSTPAMSLWQPAAAALAALVNRYGEADPSPNDVRDALHDACDRFDSAFRAAEDNEQGGE